MSMCILAFLLGLFSGAAITVFVWIGQLDREIRLLQAEADAADREMDEKLCEMEEDQINA